MPAWFRQAAMSVVQSEAPSIARPGASLSVRRSRRASGRSVKPCRTMVAAITANTQGTISSAPW